MTCLDCGHDLSDHDEEQGCLICTCLNERSRTFRFRPGDFDADELGIDPEEEFD